MKNVSRPRPARPKSGTLFFLTAKLYPGRITNASRCHRFTYYKECAELEIIKVIK